MASISVPFARACIETLTTSNTHNHYLIEKMEEELQRFSSAPHIPLGILSELLTLAQLHSGNEDLGITAYGKAHPSYWGALGYLIMSSRTLQDVLVQMVEYHSVIGSGFTMSIDEQASDIKISGGLDKPDQSALPRIFIDTAMSMTLGLLQWLVPNATIIPSSAAFTYPKPRNTEKLEAFFGNTLEFSASINALSFSRADCSTKLPTHDPVLHSIHNDHLELHKKDPFKGQGAYNNDTVAGRSMHLIQQQLSRSISPTIASVGEGMQLSARQLSRALQSEGQRFTDMVDEVKSNCAKHLLTNTTTPLKQISYTLGFKNPSAFNKASFRWFGMAPSSYRSSKTPTTYITNSL